MGCSCSGIECLGLGVQGGGVTDEFDPVGTLRDSPGNAPDAVGHLAFDACPFSIVLDHAPILPKPLESGDQIAETGAPAPIGTG